MADGIMRALSISHEIKKSNNLHHRAPIYRSAIQSNWRETLYYRIVFDYSLSLFSQKTAILTTMPANF
jgi:hypothetical protein